MLLTEAQAAREAQVDRRTIRRLIRSGRLRATGFRDGQAAPFPNRPGRPRGIGSSSGSRATGYHAASPEPSHVAAVVAQRLRLPCPPTCRRSDFPVRFRPKAAVDDPGNPLDPPPADEAVLVDSADRGVLVAHHEVERPRGRGPASPACGTYAAIGRSSRRRGSAPRHPAEHARIGLSIFTPTSFFTRRPSTSMTACTSASR